MSAVRIRDLAGMEYEACWQLQQRLFSALVARKSARPTAVAEEATAIVAKSAEHTAAEQATHTAQAIKQAASEPAMAAATRRTTAETAKAVEIAQTAKQAAPKQATPLHTAKTAKPGTPEQARTVETEQTEQAAPDSNAKPEAADTGEMPGPAKTVETPGTASAASPAEVVGTLCPATTTEITGPTEDTGALHPAAGAINQAEATDPTGVRTHTEARTAAETEAETASSLADGAFAGTILFVEHPPVYTLGKSGRAENMLVGREALERLGARFFHIDRGGDVTFHGPGQIVCYPILDLERIGMGLRDYIDALEEAVIRTVAEYGISAGRIAGASGVWIGAGVTPDGRGPLRKICAIGVRSSRYITMHGFALNVSTDLEWFARINPCGFTDRGVTSIERECGRKTGSDGVKQTLVRHLTKILNVEIYK